ncbi:bifunctional diaminohydroxyphosphoribosylaminopyrimidine deaminase/5-amino-6-(5-phosphoribosylamino)uracil reductase RibD [Flavobacterium beibuense]|uniref:Riboflavin biosynthesis protein RibD n=1 Tax=Flavobacterium beibuense TaxID=657326 RepID=A0A444WJ56_9FLAO|nr:bifunctional diaminohydroxyphosphoribosylaminopyrimidine deaminase/5-amino-6-(5-phosphoribosylamino)uracil reductase RibD [Flavobacterium beibuense]RYJ45712.1 Riboflavin biosynthesis protein RibD [Flavobacterium beibuense]
MNHELYMQRCLDLAAQGLREAMPNPSVGAVLVYNGKIIGEGHTSPYGGPHGEVNCVNSVKEEDKHLIPLSTLYVSLEPCSHYGKTPPCCDLIIQQQIKTIVIGITDPHEKVAGNGIKKLKEANREVIIGVLEKECREFNRRFFTFHEKKRPYIILKWAQTADGFISPSQKNRPNDGTVESKKPVWIANSYSRQLVHKWRSEEMSILAGTNTVMDDNPKLDVRDWTGPNPTRIILDRNNRIPGSYFVKNQKINTIILTEKTNLPNLGNFLFEKIDFNESLPRQITQVLYQHNIQSVIIEGGRQTLQTFIDYGLWDEARVFKGETLFHEGIKAPVLNATAAKRYTVLNDELLIFRNHD